MRNWGIIQWSILLGGIVLTTLVALVIYVLLQPDTFVPQTPTDQQVIDPTTGLPTVPVGRPDFPQSIVESIPLSELQGQQIDDGPSLLASGGITTTTSITEFPVDFVSLSPNGTNSNYYDPETNRFYQIDTNGIITRVSGQIFANVENVVYAPNRSDSVIEFPDGSNIVYNIDTNDQITLPPHWEDFDFSPSSEQLAFKSIALDPSQRFLAVADKTGSSARRIRSLGENQDRVDVDWSPNNQVIGTYSKPDGLSNSELFFIGFNNENYPVSKLQGHNFEGVYTPDGEHILYSVAHQSTNFNPSLWLTDAGGASIGQNRKSIEVQTWPHKCDFLTPSEVICGVPTALPEGAGLFPSVADDIPDELVRINLTSGTSTRIAVPNKNINVKALNVTDDGNTLIIHDNLTQTLQKIRLE